MRQYGSYDTYYKLNSVIFKTNGEMSSIYIDHSAQISAIFSCSRRSRMPSQAWVASKEKESRVGGWREPIITIDNKAFVLIIEGDYLTKCSKAVYVYGQAAIVCSEKNSIKVFGKEYDV